MKILFLSFSLIAQITVIGIVDRVVDGDTIKVRIGDKVETVRYIGVDTPETVHPTRGIEPYGIEASNFNKKLVEGKTVRLEFDVERRDQYGRLLAYVYVDTLFVNAELLRQGYAQLMTIPPNVRYVDLFVRLQGEAREAKRGLWGLARPTSENKRHHLFKTLTILSASKRPPFNRSRTGNSVCLDSLRPFKIAFNPSDVTSDRFSS